MAKEFYDVSYKTYFNDRIKPTVFRGKESYPLYVRVTFDRETIFFKSYYFDVFARPKYDFLGTTITQIDELESGVIDFIVNKNYEKFYLNNLPRQYKTLSQDILDSFDGPFKMWLATCLKKEGLPGLATLLEYAPDEVCAIRVWDDLKKILDQESFERMEEIAMQSGPYLPLAMYVRHQMPEGPFCLPLYEWAIEAKRIEIENFIDERFWRVDFDKILREVRNLLHPNGY